MFAPIDIEQIILEKYNVPPISSITIETRQCIIAGVDKVLYDMGAKELCRSGLVYADLIRSAESVFKFIEGCKKSPQYMEYFTDEGRIPFITAEHFMVFQTFKVHFNKYLPEGMDARKLTLISPCLIFVWQLPFIFLYEALEERVIQELGPDLLEVKTKPSVEALSRLKLDEVMQGRRLLNEKFVDVLRISPNGLHNIMICDPQQYKELENILGDNIFYFMCRDTDFFNDVMRTPMNIVALLGQDLKDVAPTFFRRIARLRSDRCYIFLRRLIGMYPEVTKLFASPAFCETTLRYAIENLAIVDDERIPFEEFVRLKIKALRNVIDIQKKI